ncbi:hypothetical protein PR003_g20315 [Phytophthora rubi]|uniref:Uncharacterized protein n=1 Tax=Phytophthora rubi TaxID=129364 RepID=A0A6A4DKV6_9STRA|nr:hypothetical protein PR002_g21374 [Phytophthora rubi]KAE8993729.1 hypothetical protein PR001_g20591 [Phytophthora rubi]KAE9310255.1 hypothetical protein PR003_g20315 [Phytophthora rubi]
MRPFLSCCSASSSATALPVLGCCSAVAIGVACCRAMYCVFTHHIKLYTSTTLLRNLRNIAQLCCRMTNIDGAANDSSTNCELSFSRSEKSV